MCYYANYARPCEGPEAIDQCVELHAEAGFDHLVWNLGRSVVDYWSDLPNVTRMCELGDQVGANSWAFVGDIMQQVCPLRRALDLCTPTAMDLWGRLGMNRHYGTDNYRGVTSKLALDNPHLREVSKTGEPVSSRLCYAFDEVQQERIDILLEAHRIGVHGLVLDFCRQMPILQYHPRLVTPFIDSTGIDPRLTDAADPAPYLPWFQHRADVLTGFMQRLRSALRAQEESLARPCPIVARVPDSSRWLSLAYGLDTQSWCSQDLVDGLMLAPFPITRQDMGLSTRYHVDTAHAHGKWCVGGIGSKGMLRNGVETNTGFFHPQPIHNQASHQYRCGIDGLSFYQSESLLRMDYLTPLWKTVTTPAEAERLAACMPPGDDVEPLIGMDWHAHHRGRYGLQVSEAGEGAL